LCLPNVWFNLLTKRCWLGSLQKKIWVVFFFIFTVAFYGEFNLFSLRNFVPMTYIYVDILQQSAVEQEKLQRFFIKLWQKFLIIEKRDDFLSEKCHLALDHRHKFNIAKEKHWKIRQRPRHTKWASNFTFFSCIMSFQNVNSDFG
jgi:hypothetical protein